MRAFFEEELQEIELPKNLHESCVFGIRKAEREMKRNHKKNWIRRVSAVAAVFVICLLVFNDTVVADTVKGFFRDIVRGDGAIVGTEYIVGQDEIELNCMEAIVNDNQVLIPIEVKFLNPDQTPFSTIESIQMGDIEFVDESENVVHRIKADENAVYDIKNGVAIAEVVLDASKIDNEKVYTLKVQTMYGHSKADAPLEIQGDWDIETEY